MAKNMKRGCVVVYESTVDPGTTENKCVPILEKSLVCVKGIDFYVGYSPERVSPGEQARRVGDIAKFVAGSTPEVTDYMAELYSRVVKVGLFKAASIKVAELLKFLKTLNAMSTLLSSMR